jgi:hypothetical protein
MKKVIVLFLLITTIYSCSSLRIEKRRYNKGFFVSFTNRNCTSETAKDSSENSSSNNLKQKKLETKNTNSVNEINGILPLDNNTIVTSNISAHTPQKTHYKRISHSKHSEKSKNTISTENKKIKSESIVTNDTGTKSRFNGLLYFLSLIFVPFFAKKNNTSLKVSKWASKNKLQSRTLIGIATTTAILSSFGLGYISQFDIDPYMFLIPASIGVGSVLLYTSDVNFLNKPTKNKLSFSLLNVGTYFGSFAAGSSNSFLNNLLSIPEDPFIINPALAFILTAILIVAFAFSLYALAIISCQIACNGYGVLAVIVLFGGGYLASYLFSLGLLEIFRRKSQENDSFKSKAALLGLFIFLGIILFVFMLSII